MHDHRRTITLRRLCMAASVLLFALWGLPSWAQGAGPSAEAPGVRRVLGMAAAHASPAQSPQAHLLQPLRERAAAQGKLHVIVGVRAAFAPEGQLSAPQAQAQRNDIAAAQGRVEGALPRLASARARRFDFIPFMALQVDAEQFDALANSPHVTDIQEDFASEANLAQSVPMIKADQAWAAGRTGNGWAVAVLDTGVLKTHSFVGNKIISEACYSNAVNGYDASQGQYVYSLCPNSATSSTSAGSAGNCSLPGACSHGTHVAGIAAGSGADAGVSFSGVAKGASLLPIQVFRFLTPDNTTSNPQAKLLTYSSDQILAMQRVYALRSTYNIASVNMSLGGNRYFSQASCDSANSSLKAAIDQLRSVGIATVISSGNSAYTDSLSSPACISSAISVGSVWDATSSGSTFSACGPDYGGIDKVTCYSNSASFLDLLAPGSAINSSTTGSSPNTFAVFHGTSMAAPHVAGCIAILKEAKPTATVDEVEAALKTTGVAVQDYRNGQTTPRINCKAALDALAPSVGSFALSVTLSGSGSVSSTPAGINCGSTCSANFVAGSTVTLTATAAAGSTFAGWSGACTGTGTCTVVMSAARSVTASFNSANQVLYVNKSGTGDGTVGSSPAGLQCAPGCTSAATSFAQGSSVTLTATANANSTFTGWGGACSGTTTTCTVTMSAARSVTAAFAANTSGGYATTALLRSGLSGAAGSMTYFAVDVPAGAVNLMVSTDAGTGDADLYVRASAQPTVNAYDCTSYTPTGTEVCTLPKPQTGNYQVGIYGFEAYSGLTLRVTYELPVSLSVQRAGTGSGTVTSTSVRASFAQAADTGGTDPAIVGGSNAQAGSWPWQVQLSITDSTGTYMCGGSILSERWVVTAAHCVDDNGATVPASGVTVRAGSITRSAGGTVVRASRVIKHPAYNTSTDDNDIALIELATPLTFGTTIAAIDPMLAADEAVLSPNGAIATVTGWGTTTSGGTASNSLMQVSLPVITTALCRSSNYGTTITENMICAGYLAGAKDSCQGDSGGPLVVSNGRGSYALLGVVSFGAGCAQANYPGVYARVSQYTAWLQTNTGLSFGQPLINCGTTCSAMVGRNATVTLRAAPAAGSVFTGWSGACTGTADCTIAMSAASTAVANFATGGSVYPLNLAKTGTGKGTVSSSPSGLACADACTSATAAFASGVQVTLTAAGGPGSVFAGWSGACSGSGTCTVTLSQARDVTARFDGDAISPTPAVQVSQLYVALFGRAPEADGLNYWAGRRSAGDSVSQIANAMYGVAPARAYYPASLTNREIVNSFYVNVLGRQPDTGGLDYWTGRLNTAGSTAGSVIAEMIAVVAMYQGSVADGLTSMRLFNNRSAVAAYYAQKGGSVNSATAALANVTDDPQTVATAKSQIDSGALR